MASWTVVENRNATNHIRPTATSISAAPPRSSRPGEIAVERSVQTASACHVEIESLGLVGRSVDRKPLLQLLEMPVAFVPLREDRLVERPRNREKRIVPRDAELVARIIELRALVL